MKNLKEKVLMFLCSAAIAFATLSCELGIGLGSAVDTETPKIIFDESIPDNAIIQGKFTVKGTWSDDGVIKVTVNLLDNKNGNENVLKTWELSDDESPRTKVEGGKNQGTWKCEIDSKEVPDSANYKLEVIIKDKFSHSSTITKTLTIDNTPPVLVITRPNLSLIHI